MDSLWINLSPDDRVASVQAAAAKRKIDERAVEKDWWVTAVLNALYHTDCAPWLNFKGAHPSVRDGRLSTVSARMPICPLAVDSFWKD